VSEGDFSAISVSPFAFFMDVVDSDVSVSFSVLHGKLLLSHVVDGGDLHASFLALADSAGEGGLVGVEVPGSGSAFDGSSSSQDGGGERSNESNLGEHVFRMWFVF